MSDKLITRRLVKVSPMHWVEFLAWLNRPAKLNKNLRKLALTKPVWDDN